MNDQEHVDDSISLEEFSRRSRRSLLVGGLATVAGGLGWRWIHTQPRDQRIPTVLRRGHELNEAIWSRAYDADRLAPTFDRSESSLLRVNGRHGLSRELDADAWRVTIEGFDGQEIGSHSIDDVRALPKHEMTVEHKCVEGWSHVVTWGGTRFSELVALHAESLDHEPRYVSLETPDRGYYVGLDFASAMHSQTMLTYDLQGEPLSEAHGAPLRLTTPLKYGTKQLKRIGRIQFTDERPRDYWGERGYDWYAGL